MEALTKTRRIGGSLVVTLPRLIVEQEGLSADQTVKIEVQKIKKSGFGLFKKMSSFSKESEFKGQLE